MNSDIGIAICIFTLVLLMLFVACFSHLVFPGWAKLDKELKEDLKNVEERLKKENPLEANLSTSLFLGEISEFEYKEMRGRDEDE